MMQGPRPGGPGGPGGPRGMHTEKAEIKDAKKTIFRLLGYLRGVKAQLLLSLLFLLIASATQLAVPYLSGKAVLNIAQKDGSALLAVLALMALYYGISALFSFAKELLLVHVAQRTVLALRNEMFQKLQTLPLRFFDSRSRGDLMSRLSNDVDNVANLLASTLSQFVTNVINILGALCMMLIISPLLTALSLVVLPMSVVLVRKITRYTRKQFKLRQEALGSVNGIVEETVTGAKVVKVFGRESQVIADFQKANGNLTQAGIRADVVSGLMGPMTNMINNIGFALTASVGGALAVAGVFGIDAIQSILQYSRQFSRPINMIAQQISMIQSALAGAERVFAIMDEPPEEADAPNALALERPRGEVVFEGVDFGYCPENPVLKDISLHAEPGQTIALVGPTGAGKTTVVNLLMRFYDVDRGQVRIDGHDVRTMRRSSLRLNMGMVLQDVYLFSGTVRDNIRYGRLDATDEEIRRAAQMANAEPFILRMPEGYETVLTEDGGNLSQGQRQLLSIARAILADPAVLILDEATSSVDTRTEMHIQQAMLRLMQGKTAFVIAHRLSTIVGADQILVIQQGRIVEQGSHESLLAQGGFYAELYNSQLRRKQAG